MTVYLSNSFSLNMIDLPNLGDFEQLDFTRINAEYAREYLNHGAYISIVGHADTARIIENMLGLPVEFNRSTVTLDFCHDIMIVAQYTGPRLPEGTPELPEGAEIKFIRVMRPELAY